MSRGAESRAAEPDPALSWCAAQKRHRNLDDIVSRASRASRSSRTLEQRGQTIDLLEATACPRHGIGGLDKLREPHPLIVAQVARENLRLLG